ncbi:MAG: chloride channel protein [Planctomycetes bacterium]|nr:chloride channel protein [Planctomycetota bacterium]MCB9916624.1 chloride channel protein [Planctomycetota bacterium]
MSKLSRASLGAPLIYVHAAVVGVLGAFCGIGFQGLVDVLQATVTRRTGRILDVARSLPWWERLLVPTLGGLAAALVVRLLVKRTSAFGVSDLMEVVSLRRLRVRMGSTVGRSLSSACVIATGGSVGREGPIIQLGAAFASRVAHFAKVGPRREAILLGCGVAAGMAAAYNAPFAGAFFVMEVLLANFAMDVFVPVILSAVVSALVMHSVRGDAAIYVIPGDLHLDGTLPVAAALLLGIPGGALAVLFMRTLDAGVRTFARLHWPPEAKAALGGLVVGVIGLGFPEVWGNGYDATSEVLAAKLPVLGVLLPLLLLKPLATGTTVGSGGAGGVFTPTLFLGAAAGTLFGLGFQWAFPSYGVPVAAFAVMGMASTIAGTTHAPLMSTMMLFEMTHNRGLLLPLLLVTISAVVTSRSLSRDSIYTRKLRERGVPVDASLEELTLRQTRVRDVMRAQLERVRVDTTFDDILQRFQETRADVIYVVSHEERLLGRVDLQAVKTFLNQPELGPIVIAADVMQPTVWVDPDRSLAEIIELFDSPDLEELPVVEGDERVLLGRVTRRDLIACLDLEVLKRQSLRARFMVQDDSEPHYVELPRGVSLARVPIPRWLAGRTIGTSGLREEANLTILTLVDRDEHGVEHRVVPDPGVVLHQGQSLVVLGAKEAIAAFRARTG